ncbi:MAG: zinc-dependent alcohol dehydrogenase family protein [Candidatus Promineifilaceae bacterium]|nr:zinc-dependent alcohol dehydrogenase family protein [Candidatus Promineifilaceae bacterium]
MTQTMNCMRLHTPGEIDSRPLRHESVAIPEPAPGQILLKVSKCGVCHTDLHTVEGDLSLPVLPITPGHQVVGTVESTGSLVTRHRIGDRVGVAWLNWTCGKCVYCRSHLENLCENARFTGLHADGGYAQYLVVDERYAFAIPEVFSDAQAAPLLCAGIIGYRSLRLSSIKPGKRLGLYGFGASAHLAIQVARHWQCEVYVFTRSLAHQAHARELGAVWTGLAQDKPSVELDASITFAPAGWIVPLALNHLHPGGTLAINAIHMSPIPEMSYENLYGERVLRTVTNFTRKDAEEFLKIASEIPITSAVEHFHMQEANESLQRLKNSEIRGAAVLQW